MTKLTIVVPCYNEQEVLPETIRRLLGTLDRMIEHQKILPRSCVYLVDDGSQDGTWKLIEEFADKDPRVIGIKLSRNVGHQNALLAGLLTADGDALVSIDADLQDDVNIIEEMMDEFRCGKEVVYGARKRRDTDGAFKRLSARAFYKILRLMGVDLVEDHADFRLLGRRAIGALKDFREVNLFLRGVVPLLGYQSAVVYYDRAERFAGASKYPLRRMLALAIDGVTSFSVVPLRIITAIGMIVFLASTAMAFWVLISALFFKNVVPGWASTVLPIYFIGGVQIFCIGVLGEYAGKIYSEVKQRPRFIIEKTTEIG
jgi:glycosyltransferase involved in cell wall biosynthesis